MEDFNQQVTPLLQNFRGIIRQELRKGSSRGREKWYKVEPTDELVEDLSQDALMEAWRRWGDFNPERASLSTWLGWIVRGRVLNYKKYKTRHPDEEPEEKTGSYEQYAHDSEPSKELEAAENFDGLGQKEQLLLTLYSNGTTNQQIASIFNSTTHSIEQQISRLKYKLSNGQGRDQ